MKTQFFSLALLLLFGLLTACQRDPDVPVAEDQVADPSVPVIDTAFPKSYFPVYPGSTWEYRNENGQLQSSYTHPGYVLDSYWVDVENDFHPATYVPRYVGPIFYGEATPIWCYESHTGPISNAASARLVPLLIDSAQLEVPWTVYAWQGTDVARKIVAKDSTLIIQGQSYFPTIVVEEFYRYGPPSYIWIRRYYFTEHIGLVKMEDSDSTYLEIESYFIND